MASVLDLVKHYQHAIEKYPNDEQKILKSIDKLFNLDVTVQHLQETGVGRTVNALRKEAGDVGYAARALVYKWKLMVAAEESDQDGDHNTDTATHNGHENGRDSDDNAKQNSGNSKYDGYDKNSQNVKKEKELNGNYSGGKRKQQSSEDEEPDIKKSRSSGNGHHHEDNRKQLVQVKREPKSEDESDSDHYTGDSDSDESESSQEEYDRKIKQEIKQEPSDDYKSSTSKQSSGKSSGDHKRESSSSKTSHESEKHSKRHHSSEPTDRHQSSKEKSHSSHKHKSSKEKDKSDKNSKSERSSSDKDKKQKEDSKSSSKHKSSSDKHKSSNSDNSSEKHKSEHEKHSSKSEKHRSSSHSQKSDKDKHKSSSEKEISDDKHKSKHNSSSKEKHSSTSKERSKDRSSSSKDKTDGSKESHHSHKSEKKTSSSDSKSKHSDSKHKSEKHDESSNETKSKHKSSSSSSHKSKSSSSKSKEDVPKKKNQTNSSADSDDGIDCGSGASFAEALGMVSPAKPKKKPPPAKESFINMPNSKDLSPASLLAPTAKLAPLPLPMEISALPDISPNYKPRPPPKLMPHFTEEEALSSVISSKNQRTKVYSGNKVIGKIPSLYEMCVQILQEHIDALEYTGGVPYDILKPVVDRATPQQLFVLEHYNPYLMEDTDHLWEKFCLKNFRNKQRQEMETWREMYMRCQEEQEHRLKSLTANIRMTQEAKKAPIKQTKMAYVDSVVKPPRNIARKQALHGTAHAAAASPAARVASLAAAPNVLRGGVRPPPAAPSSGSSFKPKKAPLMQKALQFMRGRKR